MQAIHFTLMLALTAGALAGCGGGSDKVSSSSPAAPVVTLSAPATVATLAGGPPIALTASTGSGSALTWQLGGGAPGSLSAASGATVHYLPPASGLTAPVTVPVTVNAGSASKSLTLTVAPDPGAARVEKIADIESLHGGEPTMFVPAFVAGDGNGNVYVGELQRGVSPSRQADMAISRISASGALTKVAYSPAAGQLRLVQGMAADRTGNLYVIAGNLGAGTAGVEWGGFAIYKIAADGTLSVHAGDVVRQIGAITDGQGKNARFLDPKLAGIDPDGNLFIHDAQDKVRKVTPGGLVTTVAALPAWVGADLDGAHYVANAARNTITKAGTGNVVAGTAGCLDIRAGALPSCIGSPGQLVQLDAATYVFIATGSVAPYTAVMKLVLPH
jgi:hypothetical protein